MTTAQVMVRGGQTHGEIKATLRGDIGQEKFDSCKADKLTTKLLKAHALGTARRQRAEGARVRSRHGFQTQPRQQPISTTLIQNRNLTQKAEKTFYSPVI